MKLYDTLSNKKKELIVPKNKTLRLFVCGPTVYDYSHIGHARTYVIFDVFVKYLRYLGFKVNYVQNITDIDDKIIEKANDEKVTAKELAVKFEKYYMQDMEQLGINSVNTYARASEYINEIINQIKKLIKKNFAYQTSTGVYFRVKNFKEYGKLSKQNITKLREAVNIDKDTEKENYIDFALWKISKPNEPKWDSPWGQGRPGWHIEDTAITYTIFKSPQYEIHGGARDLIFPHHEAEIAQIESAYNKPPLVKFWMHTGYLEIKGEKMSKSLKNFITIQDILKKYSPQTIRLFFTTKHYRSPINYTKRGLVEAKANEKRLEEFWMNLNAIKIENQKKSDKQITNNIKKFWDNLEDDFNTPKAFSELFNLVTYVNKKKSLNKKDKKIVTEFLENINKIFNILDINKKEITISDSINAKTKGVESTPKKIVSIGDELIPTNIVKLINEREKLKKEKKWNEADVLRKKIEKIGYIIEDLDDRYRIRKK